MSDKWEVLNGRDPEDGLLLFDFNCGGWQTEGWEANGIESKLAGFLGYIDFELSQGSGTIYRNGLQLSVQPLDNFFEVRLRSSEMVDLKILVNGKILGTQKIFSSKEFKKVSVSLSNNPTWRDSIHSLELSFDGLENAVVEIDSIRVVR